MSSSTREPTSSSPSASPKEPSSTRTEASPSPSSSSLYKACKPIIAGGITGGIETLVLYPTEYVKTHLQLQGRVLDEAAKSAAKALREGVVDSAAALGSHQPPTVIYSGMMDCYVKTVQSKGPFGLYQGMTPYLVGAIPKQATRWGVFELSATSWCSFKRHVLHRDPNDCQRTRLTLAEVSGCGLVAGAMEACIAAVPMDTIKTRLIDDAKAPQPQFQNKSLPVAVSMMVRQEGIRGIYKGVGGTVMKQSVNQMVRFPVQQATMNVLCSPFLCRTTDPQVMRKRRKAPFWNGFAGFIAGIVSVFMSQPFDVVKTRMQSQTGSRYKGSMDCFRTILREDGARKMYSGSVPRMMRVGGNVALTFTLFPIVKELL